MDAQRQRIMQERRRRFYDKSEVSLCLKYILFFSNFIFLIIFQLALILGIYIAVLKDKEVTTAVDILLDPSIYLLISGIVGTIMSFLGCLGALREITCVLKCYYILINFFLLLELVVVIFAFLFAYTPETLTKVGIYPEDLLKDAITRYRIDEDMEDFIDNVQQSLGCCGYSNNEKGYKDWDKNEYFNCSKDNPSFEKCAVPWSCCKFSEGENVNLLCGADALKDSSATVSKINQEGCLMKARKYIIDNIFIIVVILICFCVEIFFVYAGRNLCYQIAYQQSKWQRG